jgi:hypothetical protein
MEALFFIHFFHYFYVPSSGPWYAGNIWGNVFVIAVVFPLGYLWSKLKWWPLKPMEHLAKGLHTKLDGHITRQREHNEWMAKHMAIQHEHITGEKAAPHPHFGRLDAESKTPE